MNQDTEHRAGAEGAHEAFDAEIDTGAAYKIALILALTTLGAMLIVVGVRAGLERMDATDQSAKAVLQTEIDAQRSQGPPLPRLQPDPTKDMVEMRAAQDKLLGSYGWVDRSSGVVRIPIDRAMDMLAARGLGAKPSTPPPPAESH